MKVRNLLLAGLAVAAMTACSNENDEFVNNGNQTGEKNAIMEFGIAFPSLTRATETGLSAEQDFQSATVIISYESGGKDVTIIPRIKFEESTPNVLYTKDKITVQPGNATVDVVLNPTSAIEAALTGDGWFTSIYNTSTYNAGEITGIDDITGKNNFLMSSDGKTKVKFVAEQEVPALVKVSRVAAKLEETTPTNNAFDVANSSEGTAMKDPAGNAIKVEISISNYSYANLQTTSYVFPQTNAITPALFQEYTLGSFAYKPITGITTQNEEVFGSIVYCLENYGENHTMAIYKATATINDEAKTFWVDRDNVLYQSINELKAVYTDIETTTSIADCWSKYGVRKYEEGVCYYKADILSNGKAEIVRNNVYKLKVTGIAKLGLPEPKDEPKLATLKLSVEVEPWTIQTNNFEFK